MAGRREPFETPYNRCKAGNVCAEGVDWPGVGAGRGVAHIDFPAARCKLVLGKVQDSLIGLYFKSLACFVQRQRLEVETSARKRRCRPIRRILCLPIAFYRAFGEELEGL